MPSLHPPTCRAAAPSRLLGVQAGRGVAALLVVLMHVSDMLDSPRYFSDPAFGGVFRFGHAGVDFFFVLSGFIIYHVHHADIGRPAMLAPYGVKRAVRIYPVYWVVMALFGAILVFSPTRDRSEQELAQIVGSLLLLPSLRTPIIGVAWTLRHELLFYLLFALLILNRGLGRAVLAAWFVLTGWNIAVAWVSGTPWFGGIAGDLLFRIFNIEFLFGMVVARACLRRPSAWGRSLLVAGGGLFLAVGLLESFGPKEQWEYPPRHLGYALGAALALYGAVSAERSGRLRPPAGLVARGTASYSVYLLHTIVIMICQVGLLASRPVLAVPREAAFLLITAIAVAAGLVFSRLVEQPLLRSLRPRRAPQPQAA